MTEVDPTKLFVETPLYAEFHFSPAERPYISHWFSHSVRFDAFCVECEQMSTWSDIRSEDDKAALDKWTKLFRMQFRCARSIGHIMRFEIMADGPAGWVMKTGQWPSHADIAMPELKKFSAVLGKERAKELNRAVGLASHGVGVGSFVYLRRIFESLLEEHRVAASDAGMLPGDFNKLRVSEKIDALAATLPPAIVEHKAIYGLLSKGLHELTEAECLDMFPVLTDGLMLILEQDLEAKRALEREAALKAKISQLSGKHAASLAASDDSVAG